MSSVSLRWNTTRFTSGNHGLDTHIFTKSIFTLISNKEQVVEFLRRCDFQLIGYRYVGKSFIIQKNEDVFMDISEEGTGFNILLNLAGLLLMTPKVAYRKNKVTGKFDKTEYFFDKYKEIDQIHVVKNSIKPYIHPILFDKLDSMRMECKFLSSVDVRSYLKCAVNPLGDCSTCSYFEPEKKNSVYLR